MVRKRRFFRKNEELVVLKRSLSSQKTSFSSEKTAFYFPVSWFWHSEDGVSVENKPETGGKFR